MRRRGAPVRSGVRCCRVASVKEGSRAAAAGVLVNDIVEAANGYVPLLRVTRRMPYRPSSRAWAFPPAVVAAPV